MAKTQSDVKNVYPDLSGFFAAKEQAQRKRAKEPPSVKLKMVQELNEVDRLLKSAKVIQRNGIKKRLG
jgi:hypothetical protein